MWGWYFCVFFLEFGREVEVGSFLGDGERRELARRLQDLLARALGRAGAAPGGT